MSHFSVLVITDQKPTQDVLAKVLQPWHEYECTGVDDEYVVDVDVTDKLMEEWNKPVAAVRLADGRLLSRYSTELYTGRKWDDVLRQYKPAFKLPEGATELEAPQSELEKTLEEFAKEYGGWEKKTDGRFYDHTNVNKRWDWWQVGGRYTGKLSGYDPDKDPANRETCFMCGGTGKRNDALGQEARAKNPAYTCNGCEGKGWSVKWPTSWKNHPGDKMRVSHLDMADMKKTQQDKRREWAQECCDKSGVTWEEMDIACREQDAAHADWEKLTEPRPRGTPYTDWLRAQGGKRVILARAQAMNWELPDVGNRTLEEWITAAPAVSSYAVVKDGQWYERGQMGWFGASFNEKPAIDWEDEVVKLIESLRPDQWITVVDCHI